MDIIDWIIKISEMREREGEREGRSKERGREGECIGKSWTFFKLQLRS